MIPFRFENDSLYLLDQRALPHDEIWIQNKNEDEVINSIKLMVVRGAPLIGFSGLFALALWIKNQKIILKDELIKTISKIQLARPTAVNLVFELERVKPKLFEMCMRQQSTQDFYQYVLKDCQNQINLLKEKNLNMAKAACADLKSIYGDKKLNILTHCNTGELACGCIGTALGAIFYASQLKMVNNVWVDETRPYLQGSRLTAYELLKEEIPHAIVVEGAAHYLASEKKIDAIFVGADRIAANGDTANKVGTANLALISHYYKIPFYVLAPLSSFDFSIMSGSEIHVEMRDPEEILSYHGKKIAPHQSAAYNPCFDISPGSLIYGIISERGLIKNPSIENLKEWSV